MVTTKCTEQNSTLTPVRRRTNNFEQPKSIYFRRKEKRLPILKGLWSHGRITGCSECLVFNNHLKNCLVSDLNEIKNAEDGKKLNLECLTCYRHYLHLTAFKCPNCKIFYSSKNFNRHIDECRKSPIDKEFCFECRRDCHIELTCNDGIWHQHRCQRNYKMNKLVKRASKRRKILRMMEREGLRGRGTRRTKRKIPIPKEPTREYVLEKLHGFINETRKKRKRISESLKLGLTLEYSLISCTFDYDASIFQKLFPSLNEYPQNVNFSLDNRLNYSKLKTYIEKKSIFYGDERTKAEERSKIFLEYNPIPEEESLLVYEDLNLTATSALYLRKKNDLKNNVEYSKKPYSICLNDEVIARINKTLS